MQTYGAPAALITAVQGRTAKTRLRIYRDDIWLVLEARGLDSVVTIRISPSDVDQLTDAVAAATADVLEQFHPTEVGAA